MSALDAEAVPDEPEIANLEFIENPANVLSFYVEWRTDQPVLTDLTVDCGSDYFHQFGDSELRTEHQVFVMGLLDGTECEATVVATGRHTRGTASVSFSVGPLPDDLPDPTLVFLDETYVQPGWTLFNLSNELRSIPLHAAIVDTEVE